MKRTIIEFFHTLSRVLAGLFRRNPLASDRKRSYRLSVCRACPYHTWRGGMQFCRICNCAMAIKTRLTESECPEGKW